MLKWNGVLEHNQNERTWNLEHSWPNLVDDVDLDWVHHHKMTVILAQSEDSTIWSHFKANAAADLVVLESEHTQVTAIGSVENVDVEIVAV